MKAAVIVFTLAAASAVLMNAQFGGIVRGAKDRVDRAQQKAKPVTDRAEKAAETYTAWTPEEEQAIGEASAAKMIAIFGLVDSPKLTRYVNLVGQSVAQFAPRQLPYRFGVLDTEIVGAYALPGGFIFITKTALEGMEDEAQLAGALGHEIIHASERHLENEIRGKKTSTWAIEEAKSKTARQTPEMLRGKGDALVKDMFDTRLSRDKEDGADERGTLMAVQAGYSAAGLMQFLRTLEQVQAKPQNQRAFGQMLSTHPPFNERVEHLKPIVEKVGGGGQTLAARFNAAIK